ncbi:retrovirus-related Pol polyprotein from type-1 retrotransposable element R2, partial [Clonorchis sinensis]
VTGSLIQRRTLVDTSMLIQLRVNALYNRGDYEYFARCPKWTIAIHVYSYCKCGGLVQHIQFSGNITKKRCSWVPESVFPQIFIRGIKLRCNVLRTRVRSARHGHSGQTIMCRGNCGQPESLMHILQSCWITHDARCARHNRVARELAKRLRRLGYTVFEELRAPTSTSFIKPDLIAVRERRATVIDVSIVSDGRGVTVWNEKKQKYGGDEFFLAIISALRAIGCDVDFLVHQPMIISYRGICFPQSAKAVIGLRLPKVTVSDLCLLAIVGSLLTYFVGNVLEPDKDSKKSIGLRTTKNRRYTSNQSNYREADHDATHITTVSNYDFRQWPIRKPLNLIVIELYGAETIQVGLLSYEIIDNLQFHAVLPWDVFYMMGSILLFVVSNDRPRCVDLCASLQTALREQGYEKGHLAIISVVCIEKNPSCSYTYECTSYHGKIEINKNSNAQFVHAFMILVGSSIRKWS